MRFDPNLIREVPLEHSTAIADALRADLAPETRQALIDKGVFAAYDADAEHMNKITQATSRANTILATLDMAKQNKQKATQYTLLLGGGDIAMLLKESAAACIWYMESGRKFRSIMCEFSNHFFARLHPDSSGHYVFHIEVDSIKSFRTCLKVINKAVVHLKHG